MSMAEHLPRLDALATAAAGRLTEVFVDEDLPIHLLGMADYFPRRKVYCVRLNPSLFSWRADDLRDTLFHECAHIRLNHVRTDGDQAARSAVYLKIIQAKAQSYAEDYPSLGAQRREAEASAEAVRLSSSWPFAAYSVWNILRGKEHYP
jgi:hypothetical protein